MAHKVPYIPPQATYDERPAAPRHSMPVEDTVIVRRTETSDGDALMRLAAPEDVILSERFGSWDVPRLTEQSLLAITAQDAFDPSERACGFAAFCDAPNWPKYVDPHKWGDIVSTEETTYNAANSMWLHLFFADHSFENDAANTILSTGFATLSEVEFCLLALPASIPLFPPLTACFEEISRPPKELTNGKAFVVYVSRRQQYIPVMFIRPARVEDHDDLLPVFGNQAETLNDRYGDYGLSDVLASDSDTMRTLVAEVDGRAIGLISLNSDVELIKVLGGCFELTSYDHLMKYPEGVVPPSLRAAAQAKQYDDLDGSDDGEGDSDAGLDGANEIGHDGGHEHSDADSETDGHGRGHGHGHVHGQDPKTGTGNTIPSISHVVDDDVDEIGGLGQGQGQARASIEGEGMGMGMEMGEDGMEGTGGPREMDRDDVESLASEGSEFDVEGLEPNAFAVTLFCIAEGFESRAYELLGPAFDAFPDRDFCVITLPHASLEFPLLSNFNIVPPRFSGTFPQVLYVFHRHGLLALHGHLSTRVAESSDLDVAADLCSTLENGGDVMEAFNLGITNSEPSEPDAGLKPGSDGKGEEKDEESALKSYVAVADGAVAGLVVIETKCLEAAEWRAKYRLDDFIDWAQHGDGGHCELVYFVVNPIFERAAKSILNSTMRLAGKTVMHHRVFADQPAINILRDLIPVRPRRAIENVEKEQAKLEKAVNAGIAREEMAENSTKVKGTADGMGTGMSMGMGMGMRNGSGSASDSDEYIIGGVDARSDASSESSGSGSDIGAGIGGVGAGFGAGVGVGVDADGTADVDMDDYPFALYFLAKKHVTEQKVVVNSRIVVVGASDAGIAFLEHLAFIPYLHFTSLTLVSEGGLPTGDTDHFLPSHLAYDVETYHKLSLRSKIRVVDDKLIGIDREQRLAILPFDAIIPYDYLILTPGLQDQTANSLGLSVTEYKGVFTLRNEQTLDSLRSYAPLKRPDAPRRSIVYGRSMDALCAVQGLIESGESPRDIVMCWPPHSPPFSDDEHVNKAVTNTLAEMGIRCYHDMTLIRAESERGRIFAAIFEPSARAGLLGPLPANDEYVDSGHDTPVVPRQTEMDLQYQAHAQAQAQDLDSAAVGGEATILPDLRLFCKNLLVCVGRTAMDLDPDTHQAIDTACLVYDGRLVVDGEFRTNDPSIFAGGSVARFSRRLGRDACQAYLDQFDSLECGAKLGQALLTRVDPLSDGTLLLTESAPVFEEPTSIHCVLPGNLHYFRSEQTKKLTNHPVTTEGRTLVTRNKATGDYCSMFIDKYNRIASLVYLGKTPIEARNLRQLIGLPATLLNDLERRFDEGQIHDLPKFLRMPWSEAVYHDRFADFRAALGEALNGVAEWEQLAEKAREMVESDELDTVSRKSVMGLRSLMPPAANLATKKMLMQWLKEVGDIA